MVLQWLLLGGVGASIWASDKFKGDNAGEIAGDIIAKTAEVVIGAVPEVASSVVDTAGETVESVKETVAGREVGYIAGLTVFVVILCSYWSLKGSLLGRRTVS